jgi:RHS repeat-associated protein
VQQVANSTTTNYLWDETSRYGDVVLETNASGAVQTSYVLGIACGSCGNSPIGELLSQHKGGTLSYYLLDGQGSVRGLTSTSGTLTDSYSYDAFGQLTSGQTNPASNYLYTGQQYDSLSGLYDLRARYYNPAQGRFLSQDTWRVDYKNPIELNRYGYTANNPVNYSDPSGLGLPSYASLIKAFNVGVGFIAVAVLSSTITLMVFAIILGAVIAMSPKYCSPDKAECRIVLDVDQSKVLGFAIGILGGVAGFILGTVVSGLIALAGNPLLAAIIEIAVGVSSLELLFIGEYINLQTDLTDPKHVEILLLNKNTGVGVKLYLCRAGICEELL